MKMFGQKNKSTYVFQMYIYVYTITLVNTEHISTEKYPLATTSPQAFAVQYLLKRKEKNSDYEEQKIEDKDIVYDTYDYHEKETSSSRALKNDPWQGYYDFLINEGSFKFWAAFQVFTAAVLIYSAFAAVYYAKYNFIQSDYDYTDYFFGRSNRGRREIKPFIDMQTIHRIFQAISSKKFS